MRGSPAVVAEEVAGGAALDPRLATDTAATILVITTARAHATIPWVPSRNSTASLCAEGSQRSRSRPATYPPTPKLTRAVVSAFAPVDRRRLGHPASCSGGLQDAERYRGSAHMLPTPRCRGNMLAHAGPAAQEVSELVVAAAIPPRRSSALQSKHRSTSALDAAVIL